MSKPGRKKLRLLVQQDWRCFYCRRELPLEFATIDHLLPKSEGGSNLDANVVVACSWCNNKRGTRDAMQFQAWVKTLEPHMLGRIDHAISPQRIREQQALQRKEELRKLQFAQPELRITATGRRRYHLWINANCRCFYCGRMVGEAVFRLNKLVAKIDGGTDALSNHVVACQWCCARRQNMEPQEFKRYMSTFRHRDLPPVDWQDRLRDYNQSTWIELDAQDHAATDKDVVLIAEKLHVARIETQTFFAEVDLGIAPPAQLVEAT